MNEEMNLKEAKINSALKNSTKLHLNLKDRTFRNGYVIKLGADFFLFHDDVNGNEPIFFLELYNVEPVMEGKEN